MCRQVVCRLPWEQKLESSTLSTLNRLKKGGYMSKGFKYHSLAQFERMFTSLGVEYLTIPPNPDSGDLRDLNGMTRMVLDGYTIWFDDGNCFISIVKN